MNAGAWHVRISPSIFWLYSLVARCPERGGVAELKVYRNEGHILSRLENQIDAYRLAATFEARLEHPFDQLNVDGFGHVRVEAGG